MNLQRGQCLGGSLPCRGVRRIRSLEFLAGEREGIIGIVADGWSMSDLVRVRPPVRVRTPVRVRPLVRERSSPH